MKKKRSRDRIKIIEVLDKNLTDSIATVERLFYDNVREFFESELITDGTEVKKGAATNYARLNKIDILADEFVKKEGPVITKQVAEGFDKLVKANTSYFSSVKHVTKRVRKTTEKALLARYGVTSEAGKIDVLAGGWVQGLVNFKDPFRRMQEIGLNAVAQGVPLEKFRRQIKDAAFDTGARSIKHHFRTNANDAYAQFDRTAQMKYADELSLRAFIYEGGLIDNSRPFCVDREGKVYTIEEAQKWAALNWKGKNKDYDPLRDMGGHNCRHYPSFISNGLAIVLRPDLKEYFNKAA